MQRSITKSSVLITLLLALAFRGFSQTDVEFWFVAPEITISHGNYPGGEPVYFRVSALELDATVRIYQPANAGGMDTTFTVPAKTTLSIDASPWIDHLENRPADTELNKGVHIVSNNLITVYYDEDEYWNQDIFALKGKNALGTEFYTPFNNVWSNGHYSPVDPYSSIDIVATDDNTLVTITPTSDIVGHTAGETFTVNLNKGQTYSCTASSRNAAGHLGGSHITANKPIAVTLKDDSVHGAPNSCKDLIGDQTVPLVNAEGSRIVGYEYIVMRGKINMIDPWAVPKDPDGVPTGERIFIMATEPNTNVFIDGASIGTLAIPGEQIAYELRHNSTHVEGDKPIMVLHSAGFGCELGGAILPTVDGCTGSVEVSFTRSTDRPFYLNLMTIDGAKHAFTMYYEDGSSFPIPESWFERVGITEFVCLKNANKLFANDRNGGVPQGEVVKITNSVSVFHLGLIEGGETTGCKYGYFSDYAAAEGDVKIVETGSRSAPRCFGDTLQLRASGGISYSWSPSDYLDDPFIATPIATPPPGLWPYDVTIQRGCLGPVTYTVYIGISDEVEALFDADKWYFCAPDTVTFDNLSFGVDMSSVTNMQWDFDLEDPFNTPVYDLSPEMQHVYTNNTDSVIRKTVQLVVWNEQSCVSEFRRDLMIKPEITANFSPDVTEGCQPVTVNFLNATTGITERYKWNLGDGASAITPDVTHTYVNTGMDDSTYHVEMVAISPFYCSDTAVADIEVYPYLEAAFAIDTFQGCSPLTIGIDNNSAGYIDVHEWSYGDGDVSTTSAASHTHTYENNTGLPIPFHLRLIVRNTARGCTDTLERVITVFPAVSSGFLPDVTSACHGTEIGFTNLSTATASTFEWDFGDGGSASDRHPDHSFENMDPGNVDYTVRLVSTTVNLCRDTSYQTIEIHPYIKAAYSMDEFQACAPFSMELKNVSEGAISSYDWDWGDESSHGDTGDSIQTHTYQNSGPAALTNELRLWVENADGCADSMVRTITVFPEVVSQFSPDPQQGCNELEVSYSNESSESATSFLWEFGDGGSSDLANPDHLFQNPGQADSIYTTRLIAYTPDNCTDTSELEVTVFPYVRADFTFSQPTICSPQDLTLNNVSVGGDSFHWDFGDSTETTVLSKAPVVHQFSNPSSTDPVTYRITLTATNARGCSSTLTKEVTVMPYVLALFGVDQQEGCSPVTVDFTNNSIGASGYTWEFANGQSSDLDNPVMTFENYGLNDTVFNVRLLASNVQTCSDSFFIPILVHPHVDADFAIEYQDQCSPATVTFHNSSVNGEEFSWSFGGDPFLTNSMGPIDRQFDNDSWTQTATYPIELSVLSPQGCTSSISKEVRVYHRIDAGFTSITEGCHPLEVSFSSESPGASDYKWDFGDNTSSILENPENTYTNEGDSDSVYQVKLLVTSENFCTDSAFSEITVFPGPRARFNADRTEGCSPLTLSVQNLSEAATSYRWSFGDGSEPIDLTSDQEISHTYVNDESAVFYPELRLEVFTDHGCNDVITQNISVFPSVEVDFQRDSAGCSPYSSQFTNLSERASSFVWDFGDGGFSYIPEPGHTFVNTGVDDAPFYVELKGYSEFGCSDSMTRQVTVYPSPVARFSYTPIYQYYPSATVTLENQTNEGSYAFEWDFGDDLSSEERDPGSHTYDHWGEYNITLWASNDQCSDSTVHWIKIYPPQPIAAYEPDRDSGCVPLTVAMTNLSIYGEDYLWEFDDDSRSTDFEPTHTFTEPGFYQVKLTVTGEGGVDYAFHEFEVFRLPELDFFVEPTLVMLPDEPVKTFNMSKFGSRYQWDFGDGSTYEAKDTTHQYTLPGVYDVALTAWTIHGCEAHLLIPELVTVIGEGKVIYPNVFRPSNSGPTGGAYNASEHLNEIFYPFHEGVVEYELIIYNRWGERLFETTDITRGWDGYYKEQLCPQGVYVWKASVTYANGKAEVLTGDVTLLQKPD